MSPINCMRIWPISPFWSSPSSAQLASISSHFFCVAYPGAGGLISYPTSVLLMHHSSPKLDRPRIALEQAMFLCSCVSEVPKDSEGIRTPVTEGFFQLQRSLLLHVLIYFRFLVLRWWHAITNLVAEHLHRLCSHAWSIIMHQMSS